MSRVPVLEVVPWFWFFFSRSSVSKGPLTQMLLCLSSGLLRTGWRGSANFPISPRWSCRSQVELRATDRTMALSRSWPANQETSSLVLASKEQLLLNHPEARPSHFICYDTAVSRILSKCFCKNLDNAVFLPPPRPRARDRGLFFENMIKERLSWIKIWVPLFINVWPWTSHWISPNLLFLC